MAQRARRPFRRCCARAVLLALAGLAVLGGGFLWFVWTCRPTEVALDRNADGIVVLTGGASRIADAIELLAAAAASGC